MTEESRSSEEEEMKKGTRERRASTCEVHYSTVSVIKCRHCRGRAEDPEFPEQDMGGLSSLNPSSFKPLSFWEVKRDTCFFKVKSYGPRNFSTT